MLKQQMIIYVDRNIQELEIELESLGYTVDSFPVQVPVIEINNFLNSRSLTGSLKPVLFITSEYNQYLNFTRNYCLLGVVRNPDFRKIARKVNDFMIKNADRIVPAGLSIIQKSTH